MRQAYEEIAVSRKDGIVELRIHHNGSEARWALWGGLHRELGLAFAEIARDQDVRAVILTGTGRDYCEGFRETADMPAISAASWAVIFEEGRQLLNNLLQIPVPVIAAVQGRAFIHAELPLLSDIVLASDTAVFADKAHTIAGVVPGDGVHVIWPMLLGPNRGRYFLMTGQEISADEALRLGLVGEVLASDALLSRAWEHAEAIASRPALTNRYMRRLLTRSLRSRLAAELDEGLALEGLAVLSAQTGN